jgi:hypothetical protein
MKMCSAVLELLSADGRTQTEIDMVKLADAFLELPVANASKMDYIIKAKF